MDLYIGQVLDAVERDATRGVDLRSINYTYTLRPHSMAEPLFRWEYVKFPEKGKVHYRHHLQGGIELKVLDRGVEYVLDLNRMHMPTGWVVIEEVIRFCLVDLGVPALAPQDEWHETLVDSYELFKRQFAHLGEA